jgi:hypothetical protein
MDWLAFIVGRVAASPRHAPLRRMQVGRPVRIVFLRNSPPGHHRGHPAALSVCPIRMARG